MAPNPYRDINDVRAHVERYGYTPIRRFREASVEIIIAAPVVDRPRAVNRTEIGKAMDFEKAFDRLVNTRDGGHEGGYVNNPRDPGGETKYGVSKRSYPELDIKNLTIDDAREIYRRDFWDELDGDRIDGALMYQVFDMAINSGPGNAIRCLQDALGVAPDGHFGEVSWQALRAQSQNDSLLLFLASRLEFMTKLKNWPDASRGWARRMAGNLRYAAGDNRE